MAVIDKGLDFKALIDSIFDNSLCLDRFFRQRIAKTDELPLAPTGINSHNHMHYMEL